MLISFYLQASNGGGKINLQVSIIFYTFAGKLIEATKFK
jgi:hypothetical protein